MSLPRLNDFSFKFTDLAGNLYQGMAGTVKGWFDARGIELKDALDALTDRLEALGVEHIAHNEGGVDGLKTDPDGRLLVSGDGVNYTAYPNAAQVTQEIGGALAAADPVRNAGGAAMLQKDAAGTLRVSGDGVDYTAYPSAAQVTQQIDQRVLQVGAADMTKADYDPGGAVLDAGGIPAYAAPKDHASGTTGYGVGNASNYGHVKLTNSLSAGGVLSGTAITPLAVSAIDDRVSEMQSFIVEIASTDWSDEAPYYCTKTGMIVSSLWVPAWRVAEFTGESIDADTISAISEAVGMIQYIESGTNSLTFICPYEKPTIDFKVRVGGALISDTILVRETAGPGIM